MSFLRWLRCLCCAHDYRFASREFRVDRGAVVLSVCVKCRHVRAELLPHELDFLVRGVGRA